MKDGFDTMIISGVLMVALIWLIFTSVEPMSVTAYAAAEPHINTESLAECLYENGVTLYISIDNEESEAQKEVFGESFKILKYIVCEGECPRNDVTNFPTWWIAGKKYEGVLSAEKLSEFSGCPIYQ